MKRFVYIALTLMLSISFSWAQTDLGRPLITIEGSVKGKENYEPISGVEVSTDKGEFTLTNSFGEFKIEAAIGDILIFESPEFETVQHRITSDEDVDVLVEGYAETKENTISKKKISRNAANHQRYLDSAIFYKQTDLEKSIDFIAKSISDLGKRGNKQELSESLSALGEIYSYHQQYDLAITNFKDALSARKSSKTTLLLAESYVDNKEYDKAEAELTPLTKSKNLTALQRVTLYETLGDAYKGMSNFDKAEDFYREGLKVAEKNQFSSKIIDLNSKIGDSFAKQDKVLEAEGYYSNSLNLSRSSAPERVVKENEKVADFYNDKNRYDEEIQLRKQSLDELKLLPKVESNPTSGPKTSIDTITAQRINYKIANAYIAQNKLDEAIPYLQKSIVEADTQNDLVVKKDATRKLSEVYRYKGEFTRALESYQEYVAIVDSLYIRKEQEISRAARFNREIATSQNRISSLEQERQLSQSKYDLALTEQQLFEETSKRQKWIIYTLLMGILLLGSTAFFFYRSNRQQKLANNLLALKSLRTQMNPHFIFNALNSVNNFIAKSDERSANRFLSEFSVLMRSVLENSEEDFIPLTKELELLELYVKLEHSRFEDKFDYAIEMDKTIDVEAFQIPPMLLQPYIENAIWHGLRYKEEKGLLQIKIDALDSDTLNIEITDDGIGRKQSARLKTQNQKKQKSKGMGNIKKRLEILNEMHGNQIEVQVSDLHQDGTGTKVSLKLGKS